MECGDPEVEGGHPPSLLREIHYELAHTSTLFLSLSLSFCLSLSLSVCLSPSVLCASLDSFLPPYFPIPFNLYFCRLLNRRRPHNCLVPFFCISPTLVTTPVFGHRSHCLSSFTNEIPTEDDRHNFHINKTRPVPTPDPMGSL